MLSLTHTGLHHNCQGKKKKSHIIYSSSFYFSFKSTTLNMDLNSIAKDAYPNNCLGNQRIMREIFNPFPMHRKKKKFNTDLVIFSNFACIAHLFQVFFFSLDHLNTLLFCLIKKETYQGWTKKLQMKGVPGKQKIDVFTKAQRLPLVMHYGQLGGSNASVGWQVGI